MGSILALNVGVPTTGSSVGAGLGVGNWVCRMARNAGASKPAKVKTVP